MFIALLILNIVHPGLVLKGPESGWKRRAARKSETAETASDTEMGQRESA